MLNSRITQNTLANFIIALAIICILLLSSCNPEGETDLTPEPTAEPTPAGPNQTVFWNAWEAGPHADTYDLEKGPNTYCAKCHSPTNWDPAAVVDPPPNCVSCKFPFESEPRIAKGNPLVPEDEWNSIGCEVCHKVENGVAAEEISWLDPITGYSETVTSTTELCEKCHLDTPPLLSHQRALGTGAHAGYLCTDCHNPHTTYSACNDCHRISLTEIPVVIPEHLQVTMNDNCEACHAAAWEEHNMQLKAAGNDDCMSCHGVLMGRTTLAPIQLAHSEYHALLVCVACHDASGLEVGPIEGQAAWVTFRTTQSPGGSQTDPYQSHTLQKVVSCDRCHYVDNPWNLNEVTTEQ